MPVSRHRIRGSARYRLRTLDRTALGAGSGGGRTDQECNVSSPYHIPNHWTVKDVLADRVDRSGGDDACWPWKRSANRRFNGYGRFKMNGIQFLAHRVAWEISNDAVLPASDRVLHTCDNPMCCNPKHLFRGTQADNVADMFQKGRARRTPSPGEANGAARLTKEQVLKIRSDTRHRKIIAAEYEISFIHIRQIQRRLRWRHLP